MVQNRNKLIDLFLGNLANAVIHEILGKAIDDENIRNHYSRELQASIDKARAYREKINPANAVLPDKDTGIIYDKLVSKVKVELQLRIARGYKNINMDLVDATARKFLVKMGVM